jgi:hypothetical protein
VKPVEEELLKEVQLIGKALSLYFEKVCKYYGTRAEEVNHEIDDLGRQMLAKQRIIPQEQDDHMPTGVVTFNFEPPEDLRKEYIDSNSSLDLLRAAYSDIEDAFSMIRKALQHPTDLI